MMKQSELKAKMKELKEQEEAALAELSGIREQMAQIEDCQWAAKARFIAEVFGEGFDEFYTSISTARKIETALLKPHLEKAVDDWMQEVAERRLGIKKKAEPAKAAEPDPVPAEPTTEEPGEGSGMPDAFGQLPPENADGIDIMQ